MQTQMQRQSAPESPRDSATLAVTRWGALRKGTTAWGTDGKIGRVVAVVHDRHTGEPAQLVVRHGWLWGRRLLIPLGWTIAIAGARITVNVRRAQLPHLPTHYWDAEIAGAVYRALVSARAPLPFGEAVAIRVEVRDGVVTLRGNVREEQRRWSAQRLAHTAAGVQELWNELIADDDLHRRVTAHITECCPDAASDIAAAISLGVVQLRGRVPSATLHEQLLRVVRQEPGVRAVWTTLKVDGTAEPSQVFHVRYAPPER